eukprot:2587510-Rhodomonas_salina.2
MRQGGGKEEGAVRREGTVQRGKGGGKHRGRVCFEREASGRRGRGDEECVARELAARELMV